MQDRHVHVLFVDASTGQQFAETEMPADRLPATFQLATTMHLGEQDWQVVKAEPVTAEEFIRTGKLVLTMERVHQMDPRKILYSLPTINDGLPTLEWPQTQPIRVLEMHEDDWRQIELVSDTHRDAIAAELDQVARVFRDESVDNGSFLGFRAIHVRAEIPRPLSAAIARDEIARLFPPGSQEYDGIALRTSGRRQDGFVEGGFGFEAAGYTMYGQQVSGTVRTLGVRYAGDTQPVAINRLIVPVLAAFMATHRLYLVDWCRVKAIPPDMQTLAT